MSKMQPEGASDVRGRWCGSSEAAEHKNLTRFKAHPTLHFRFISIACYLIMNKSGRLVNFNQRTRSRSYRIR